ncbi:ATP-dependent DNA helicase RecG [Eubacterium sp.]|uniref:ATP-dependent DNA helicase RecG n=1 Tax=Eubacterium sp. TaxID=142586 RepID=UPI00260D9A2B|nr:ATP-dependent DNA helicase RecG [Eubacterium sp.]MDD7331271.1 ATP-dependent DNA helicase RecG [Eubacterium sp.]
MNYGEYDIRYLKGVGEKTARLYNKLGIFTVDDLIRHYPRKYLDYSNTVSVKDAPPDTPVFIKATMITPVKESMIRKGLTLYKCNFSDGETVIRVTIFNNKYLAKALRTFDDYILYGKVEKTFTSASMSSPQIERADKAEVHPVYPTTEKLSVKAISNSVRNALALVGKIPETLSDDILKKYDLVSLDFATRQIHFPTDEKNIEPARHRLIFDELLTLQLGLLKLKEKDVKGNSCKIKKDFTNEFYSLLPFTPTGAQQRAVADCIEDMQSDRMMNRLIQGDVGSGKTAVAGAVIYTVIKNGAQAALMAPTEILATQHFESFKKLFASTDVRVALLTGSVKAGEKKEIKRALCNGEIDLIVGTHALIQNDVEFENLGLVCTDEQHRFGVQQRANLAMKGDNPHLMVMSATPIPRTLGLIIYGDLDISLLDELPPGRQEIRTDVVTSAYHKRIYKFIRDAVDRGEQAYIVCSLVDEGESDLISAKEYADNLAKNEFVGYSVGLLHGKMKPAEKDRVMQSFAEGETQILVSTTVVEVGVDVPNATVMLIENADRFGLSQLHQLRGRVGRGKNKSYCILVSDNKSDSSRERLQVMKHTSNGFDIADYDLKSRGPGDFFGKRQHGLPDLKIADMLEDTETLRQCRECALKMLESDPRLDAYPELCERINNMFRKTDY